MGAFFHGPNHRVKGEGTDKDVWAGPSRQMERRAGNLEDGPRFLSPMSVIFVTGLR